MTMVSSSTFEQKVSISWQPPARSFKLKKSVRYPYHWQENTLIELHNVALAPDCNSNLISLGQLRESGIMFHDDPTTMTLTRGGNIIAHAMRSQNLFILNTAMPGLVMSIKAMAITGRGQPTHLFRKNKRVRLWHRWLAHVSNARVIRAFKLSDIIELGLAKLYDPTEVLVDLEELDDSVIDVQRIDPGPSTSLGSAHQTKEDIVDSDAIDKQCAPCVRSKSTRMVKREKSMTPTTKKLERSPYWRMRSPQSTFLRKHLLCDLHVRAHSKDSEIIPTRKRRFLWRFPGLFSPNRSEIRMFNASAQSGW